MINHPTALPPTKAPNKPLPATNLPDGSLKVSSTSLVSTVASKATSTEQSASASYTNFIGNGTTLYILVSTGVLILACIIWFLISRRNHSIKAGMTEG